MPSIERCIDVGDRDASHVGSRRQHDTDVGTLPSDGRGGTLPSGERGDAPSWWVASASVAGRRPSCP